MNDLTKGALLFGAGLVLGYMGSRAIEDPASKVRGAAVGAISHGISLKDRIMTSVERARENVEDIVAEAKHENLELQERTKPADPKA